MDKHYDDFFYSAQKAANKDKFLKLPHHRKNLYRNFYGLYGYSNKKAHLNLPGTTIVKLGRWSPTSTIRYNCVRRPQENHYDLRELMSN